MWVTGARASVARMPTRPEIEAAAARLSPYIRRTPVLPLHPDELGCPVTLKLEFLQHTGSFKARGAFNTVLTSSVPIAGVAAASGGNHGAAVAYAAQRLGHAAAIFVPASAPATKLDRIRGYGATVSMQGAAYLDALAACNAHQAATGAMGVHAYDQESVLAGQGTVGREFQSDAPDLTHILVAVGGGGLIGGIAAWYAGTGSEIIAVEPLSCPTLHAAIAAGHPTPVSVSGVAADSLGAGIAGSLTVAIAIATGMQSVLVSDESIRDAQAWLWSHLRIASEPGGAAALAALLGGAWTPPADARVGILLCGANTDAVRVSF